MRLLTSQSGIQIEGRVRVGTGCGRPCSFLSWSLNDRRQAQHRALLWEVIFLAQLSSAVFHQETCGPHPTCCVLEQCQLLGAASTQHRKAHAGVLWAKLRHLGTPPLYCVLVASGTVALQTSQYIWPLLGVPHLRLMMVICKHSHDV